jgi:hypothetical protein
MGMIDEMEDGRENGFARLEIAGSLWQVKQAPWHRAAADYFTGKQG